MVRGGVLSPRITALTLVLRGLAGAYMRLGVSVWVEKKKKRLSTCRGEGSVVGPLVAARALPAALRWNAR